MDEVFSRDLRTFIQYGTAVPSSTESEPQYQIQISEEPKPPTFLEAARA
jgi:hypothetical protein